ncbi:uncharacterized protein Z519_07944 [Cladophialophora bantiana CBS 173.52]|uniref:TMEM205-like domain-containing protein n=1 Tax=Cladophialophora bantiana (strain ATCC 10958 / CBS 173.52 / CDC B-1940 / NIH 8579) TaxID=1442370 RepID=A0A0D2HJZ6_CLAB1|nr:uncharacterized protein Z519_07944 [Cladophialophora bantiana CBS 173.52]KIW91050.1 hypothetical protein Z519_07944 [Cladophialophora bantiana CBS 173.52]
MPESSVFYSAAPYHIISYGVLLGTTTFQSFVGGIVAFKSLPRPQFATLQQATFPIYFAMQSALPMVLALTFPAERTAIGTRPAGVKGVLHPENRLHVFTPLVAMLISGLVNMAYLGPATTKCMRDRKHQETRDGKKSYDPPPHSKEMQALNKRFEMLHGTSSLVNLMSWVGMIWYGFYLGDRIA